MTTASVDRIQGLSGSIAAKIPCRVATTAAITLSGLQTVDGVVLVEGDRVLVRAQASAVDNGLYTASSSAWIRTLDTDGANDVAAGTLVLVVEGATYAGRLLRFVGTNPILPGTSAITFLGAAEGQPADSTLEALANLSTSANTLPYATGTDTFALTPLTAAARSLLDDTDVGAMRTTLAAAGSGAVTSSGLTMSTARLLGRSTVGTGNVEEISLGSGLTFSGTTLNASSADLGVFSVKDYGALGDGLNDDTVAIQDTIDAAEVAGGTVLFPAGTYKITASLTVAANGVHLTGAGRRATILAPGTMAQDYVHFDTVSHCSFTNMSIYPTGAQSGADSAAIHVEDSHGVVIRDIHIFGYAVTGVWFEGGASQFLYYLEDFEIGNAVTGVRVGGTTLCQDVTISNGIVAGIVTLGVSTMTSGILLEYCSGVYINLVDALGCDNGVHAAPGAGQYVTATFMHEVLGDSCSNNGIFFDGSLGGAVYDANLVNCWSATNTLDGVRVTGTVDGVAFVGLRALNNEQHGLNLSGGKNYTVVGSQIGMNSMSGSATYHGVYVAAGVTNFVVTGNSIGEFGRISSLVSNLQGYGVYVAVGASGVYSITNNDLTGNVSGEVADGGTGTAKTVGGNSGGGLDTSGTLRATGVAVPASGAGLELAFDPSGTPTGWLICYDRGASAYRGLNVGASSYAFAVSGVSKFTIGASSCSFTDSPLVPTAAPGDNTTKAASTAFVQAAVTGGTAGVASFNTRTGAVTLSSTDVTTALTYTPVNKAGDTVSSNLHVASTIRATGVSAPVSGAGLEIAYDPTGTPVGWIICYDRGGAAYKGLNFGALAYDFAVSGVSKFTIGASSCSFTDSPLVPTAAPGDNTTKAASTAFVQAAVGASGVTSFNTRTGAVTLSSSDVTTALTYTPYNSSNPSGYITSSALSPYAQLSGATFSGNVNAASTIRATGLSAPASGAGVEMAYSGTTGWLLSYNRGTSAYTGLNLGASAYDFAVGGASAMKIDASSYVLVGYASSNGSYKLQVNSQIYATNATIATSDERVKTNIQSLGEGMYVVAQLRPVTFDFIDHPVHEFAKCRQVGFIAQDVETALAGADYTPSVVVTNEDGDENLKGLAYDRLLPFLVKALQEQAAQIAELQCAVSTLQEQKQ